MVRKARVQTKKNPKKRGPKSFLELARLPRRAGYKKQVQWMKNKRKSKFTMRRYRTMWNLIYELEGPFINRLCKRMTGPNTYDKRNQHGGCMPALPGDFVLTNLQAGKIFLRVMKHDNISYDQLKAVSGMFSYLYKIQHRGTGLKNFPEITSNFGDCREVDYNKSKSLTPESIPQPAKLRELLNVATVTIERFKQHATEFSKKAFTTEWNPNCGMMFPEWVSGNLAAWSWAVFGCRSGCDMTSLKESTVHNINLKDGWACTAYKNGRNKLCGKLKGTRPWNCYFVCLCPAGKHQPISPQWAKDAFHPDGSLKFPPDFCTSCPLNCFQLKLLRAGKRPMYLFGKWTKTPQNYTSWCHGSPVNLAIRWLDAQGCSTDTPYHTNAGRKSCAGMLDVTETPFPQGFEIHGDNPDVWQENYQPGLPWSEFSRRTQSPDPRIATVALRRFAHYFGRDKKPESLPEAKSLSDMLMMAFLRQQGQSDLIDRTVREYKRVYGSQDDEKTQD